MQDVLVLGGAALLGNMLAEKFILKSGPDDSSGFVEVAEGFGMDDVARAATIVGIVLLAKKFLG